MPKNEDENYQEILLENIKENEETDLNSDTIKKNENILIEKLNSFPDPNIVENQIDIFLDEVGYTRYHYNLIFIISMIYFFIGCEFLTLNIFLSTLENEWKLLKSDVTLLGSALYLGIFITSLMAGWVNNKYGRRLPSILGCICMSIFSFLACFTQCFWQMYLVKIVIGLSIGIIVPCTTSLLTEIIPRNNRSFTLNSVWGLFPVGTIYICFVAINLVTRNILYWRTVYIISSLNSIPIIFLSFYLKESPRYLIVKGRYEKAFKILNQIGKSGGGINLTFEQECKIEEQAITLDSNYKTKSNYLSSYFDDDFKLLTPLLLLMWYSSSLISYGLLYIMPKHYEIISKKDKSESLKNSMSSMYILLFEPFFRGLISELAFLGRTKSLAIGFLGASFFSFCCILSDTYLFFFAGSLVFFNNISLGIVSVYTSEVYPTQLRSGALGIGNAFTRLGGMTAPFICDFAEKHYKGTFYLFALVGLVSMFSSFFLTRETRARELDYNFIIKNKSRKENKL